MNKLLLVIIFILPFITLNITASKTFTINDSKLRQIEQKYGSQARNKVELWDSMMQNSKNQDILNQLKNVNDFFNQIRYKSDLAHWRQKDYWATPFEFMGTGAGDCEDYAIAKYFSLRELGVSDSKLRITYVTYKNQAHMVLIYYPQEGATPIVLDNINKKLKLATQRPDLNPVYSFNATGLWQAQNKGSIRVGSNNLRSWTDLMNRF